jgi:hypothetical protein
MRMLLKVNIPTPKGTEAMKAGAIPAKLQEIFDEMKPEAAYFAEDGGERTAYIFVEMAEPSDLPRLCEPFFLAFNARCTVRPAMTLGDLAKAGPAIERAIKKYA